ncbi:MAG: hypothetical protein JWM12_3664 [Ilumatobacteraceae bacterium]|nr:hypothetical protein [Ilumatobacteraceae bacterium]
MRAAAPAIATTRSAPPLAVQRKLVVGAADDQLEREADALAAQVMSVPDSPGDALPGWASTSTPSRITRREAGAGGGEVDPSTEREINGARSGGRPLDQRIRPRMERAFGADFSSVRVHVGAQSDELSSRVQAKAFTTGADVFVRRQDYAPETTAGQELLAHELAHTLQQGGSRVVRRTADTTLIQRYADIPTRAVWKVDTKHNVRSKELKAVDDAIGAYDAVRSGTDLPAKRAAMDALKLWIKEWEKVKKPAGVAKSERKDSMAELTAALDKKIRENLDAHAIELQPLVDEYTKAVQDQSMYGSRAKAQELYTAHHELFPKTAENLLKTTDRDEWMTVFLTAPANAVGAHPFTSLTIKAITNFGWLSQYWADRFIEDFIVPYSTTEPQQAHVMQMLQHGPFRKAILAKATPQLAADLTAKMPIVRIAAAAEQDAGTKANVPSVEQIADSVFSAFLGDQPISGLRYMTNSVDFKASDFLLGNSPQAKRAPCMVLSNMLTTVFKAVLPSNDPAAAINAIHDNNPLLTKPLASIGAANGILTGEAAFSGNVDRFGDQNGYATVNRIFFGDGHEWLQVGHREYDPTLGLCGPVGTVAAQVEAVKFTKKGEKYTGDNGMTATRSKKKPPGGAALLFQRTVTIK